MRLNASHFRYQGGLRTLQSFIEVWTFSVFK